MGLTKPAQRPQPASTPTPVRKAAGQARLGQPPDLCRADIAAVAVLDAVTAMAKELQLSVSRISRLIAAAEAVGGGLGQEARPDPVAPVHALLDWAPSRVVPKRQAVLGYRREFARLRGIKDCRGTT